MRIFVELFTSKDFKKHAESVQSYVAWDGTPQEKIYPEHPHTEGVRPKETK